MEVDDRVCVGVAVGVRPEVTDCDDDCDAELDGDDELVELEVTSWEIVEVILRDCVEDCVES